MDLRVHNVICFDDGMIRGGAQSKQLLIYLLIIIFISSYDLGSALAIEREKTTNNQIVTSDSEISKDNLYRNIDYPRSATSKLYGAKGDGVTDDTAAITKAIQNSEGNVRLPYGTYKITSLGKITKPFQLIGECGSNGCTKILANTTNDVLIIGNDSKYRSGTTVIKNISFANAENVPKSFIRIERSKTILQNITTEYNYVDNTYPIASEAIIVSAGLSYGHKIIDCNFGYQAVGEAVIKIERASVALIDRTDISGAFKYKKSGGVGILFAGTQRGSITNTIIEGCEGGGIDIDGTSHGIGLISIEGGHFEANQNFEIRASDSFPSNIVDKISVRNSSFYRHNLFGQAPIILNASGLNNIVLDNNVLETNLEIKGNAYLKVIVIGTQRSGVKFYHSNKLYNDSFTILPYSLALRSTQMAPGTLSVTDEKGNRRFLVDFMGQLTLGQAVNGQQWVVKALSEILLISKTEYMDSTIEIPKNVIVKGVSVRVIQTIPNASVFSVTGALSHTIFNTIPVKTSSGTTDKGNLNCPYNNLVPQKVRIKLDHIPMEAIGKIRITIHYEDITPPTD